MDESAPSNQVLANELRHVSRAVDEMKGTMGELLVLMRNAATKDEVRSGDAATMAELGSLRGEFAVLKGRQSTLEGEQQAGATRIRALEDARTAQRAVTSVLWALIGLLGVGGLGGLARYFFFGQ